MWASISAERNGSFTKWSRDWCSCSTPRKINWSHLEALQRSNAKVTGSLQKEKTAYDMQNCSRREGIGRHET